MQVSELIAELKMFDEESKVVFSYNYGDHGRTTVAKTVDRVREEDVIHSDYFNMLKVIEDDDEDDIRKDGAFTVVVLS